MGLNYIRAFTGNNPEMARLNRERELEKQIFSESLQMGLLGFNIASGISDKVAAWREAPLKELDAYGNQLYMIDKDESLLKKLLPGIGVKPVSRNSDLGNRLESEYLSIDPGFVKGYNSDKGIPFGRGAKKTLQEIWEENRLKEIYGDDYNYGW